MQMKPSPRTSPKPTFIPLAALVSLGESEGAEPALPTLGISGVLLEPLGEGAAEEARVLVVPKSSNGNRTLSTWYTARGNFSLSGLLSCVCTTPVEMFTWLPPWPVKFSPQVPSFSVACVLTGLLTVNRSEMV